jgi:hypothetical protein
MKKSELKNQIIKLNQQIRNLRIESRYSHMAHVGALDYIIKNKIKSDLQRQKENELKNNASQQAGDKIVEGNKNTDWFIKNDDGSYTIKLGTVANFVKWDNQLKKETPLADLNKEGQEELEKRNDLSCKQSEKSKDESYIIQAKEAVDKFMPLVTGWRANDPCGLRDAEVKKVVWSLSDYNHKKAAIKVAIAHFELIQKQGGWLTHIDCVQIIGELTKMLSQ